MADQIINPRFPETTNAGSPNISACIKDNRTWDLTSLQGNELVATITYEVPADEVEYYYGVPGTPYPSIVNTPAPAGRYYFTGAKARQVNHDMAELVETYKYSNTDYPFDDPLVPPDPVYSMRSSEYSNPIIMNPNFWTTLPTPEVTGGSPVPADPGEVAPWAKGFIGDRTAEDSSKLPEGVEPVSEGLKPNAFPAGHTKAGIEDYFEGGGEWTCTEFDAVKPTEADLGDTQILEAPQGLVGASAGKWRYSNFSSDFDGLWWSLTRSWSFNKNGWDADVYA